MDNQIFFSDLTGKRKTKMENQISFSDVTWKLKTKMENQIWKSKINFRFPISQENSWHQGTHIYYLQEESFTNYQSRIYMYCGAI